jgi:hypothetical protein
MPTVNSPFPEGLQDGDTLYHAGDLEDGGSISVVKSTTVIHSFNSYRMPTTCQTKSEGLDNVRP